VRPCFRPVLVSVPSLFPSPAAPLRGKREPQISLKRDRDGIPAMLRVLLLAPGSARIAAGGGAWPVSRSALEGREPRDVGEPMDSATEMEHAPQLDGLVIAVGIDGLLVVVRAKVRTGLEDLLVV
jgi:hypothetical protein